MNPKTSKFIRFIDVKIAFLAFIYTIYRLIKVKKPDLHKEQFKKKEPSYRWKPDLNEDLDM